MEPSIDWMFSVPDNGMFSIIDNWMNVLSSIELIAITYFFLATECFHFTRIDHWIMLVWNLLSI
jgi:hypothetical protein